jgi:DNA polymerase III alpha subunit (gram-positive type)
VPTTGDRDQEYIMIDIETTGGCAPADRVAEIDAVKVRNHQMIDQCVVGTCRFVLLD